MPDGTGEAFTLLTTEPGPDVAPSHDRQMVVLDCPDWLAARAMSRYYAAIRTVKAGSHPPRSDTPSSPVKARLRRHPSLRDLPGRPFAIMGSWARVERKMTKY